MTPADKLPPCVFETALLARCAACELARTRPLAEGEAVACTSPVARAACVQLAGLLRAKAAFALKVLPGAAPLPHAKVMRLQCGGLAGLKALLDAEAPAPDVHRLVRMAMERYAGLDALPFSDVVQGIAAWQGRRHGGAGGP